MDKQILEILIQMKSEFKDINNQIKEMNSKIDRIEYNMNDGFETLELLC